MILLIYIKFIIIKVFGVFFYLVGCFCFICWFLVSDIFLKVFVIVFLWLMLDLCDFELIKMIIF